VRPLVIVGIEDKVSELLLIVNEESRGGGGGGREAVLLEISMEVLRI
jgi:hypothetical protein